MRSSSPPELSRRNSKRQLFYGLLLVVFLFQVIIFPSFVAPTNHADRPESKTLEPPGKNNQLRSSKRELPADGTFNELPIYLQTHNPFHSNVHCVGETHNSDTAWRYRSCEFTNLCLDTATKKFFVVESQRELEFQRQRLPNVYVSTELSSSTNTNLSLALGGINPRWIGSDFNQGIEKVKWFPTLLKKPPASYYQLDDNVVLVPFHSFAAHNVGHMLWDDFLPIFTLLNIFGWIEPAGKAPSTFQHVLLRVDTLPLLYATCEMQKRKGKKLRQCAANFEKFLPLLGVDPATFSTLTKIQFHPNSGTPPPTTIVCAKHAVAGLGMLTDHGLKDHGWLMPKETHSVQNTAKGALLYQFRNHMLKNLNLPIVPPKELPPKIILSAHSSGDNQRDIHFENEERILTQAFPTISVQSVTLSSMSMREQVELVSQAQVFVSMCGGGAMTATFLPKGATLILYYAESGGYDFSNNFNLTGDPALLDWDLFNNMAHVRVHWLPIGTIHTPEGLQMLRSLIWHELDVMESGV